MPTAIITGSGGLIGSESVRYFVGQGYEVLGIENDIRARFFGPDASTGTTSRRLVDEYGPGQIKDLIRRAQNGKHSRPGDRVPS